MDFTEEHQAVIAELKELKEIILFFDGDEAGTEAINRHCTRIKSDQ